MSGTHTNLKTYFCVCENRVSPCHLGWPWTHRTLSSTLRSCRSAVCGLQTNWVESLAQHEQGWHRETVLVFLTEQDQHCQGSRDHEKGPSSSTEWCRLGPVRTAAVGHALDQLQHGEAGRQRHLKQTRANKVAQWVKALGVQTLSVELDPWPPQ